MNTLTIMLVLLAAPESIDSMLSGVDKLSYADRIVRWDAINQFAMKDPAAKAHLVAIAAGSKNDYSRFIAACHVAGIGGPNPYIPIPILDLP